jgi:hypothetical protein
MCYLSLQCNVEGNRFKLDKKGQELRISIGSISSGL